METRRRHEEEFPRGFKEQGFSEILISVVSVERGWRELAWTDSGDESGWLLSASLH